MTAAGDPNRWETIVANANMGMPLPPGTRHRLIKRMVGRLCWPFLAQQVVFNRELLAELVTLRNALTDQIKDVAASVSAHVPVPDEHSNQLLGVQMRLDQLNADLTVLRAVQERNSYSIEAALPVLERQGYGIEGALEAIEGLKLAREMMQQQVELANQQSFARTHDAVGLIRTELSDLAERLSSLDDSVDVIEDQFASQLGNFRIRLAHVDSLLDRVRRTLPKGPSVSEISTMPSAFESLYSTFEEVFRGPAELVKERVAEYLPLISGVQSTLPVLDVGCGRGELIELLGEQGIAAYGIEVNESRVESGRERGLDIRLEDAVMHLSELPKGSLRGIAAIQVVEHLTISQLIEFLDLATAAIESGGVLILETPNPDNLVVGASTFYLDPTHVHPIPSSLLSFLVEERGFSNVTVRMLERSELKGLSYPASDQPWKADLDGVLDTVNARLFNAQDYAVVAVRP